MPSLNPTRLAEEIDAAHLSGTLLDARDAPALDLTGAYRTQAVLTHRRTSRGARRIGWKLGYTSDSMRAQMGVDQSNLGQLLDTMLVDERAGFEQAAFERPLVQPKVEPEVGLVIGADGRSRYRTGAGGGRAGGPAEPVAAQRDRGGRGQRGRTVGPDR